MPARLWIFSIKSARQRVDSSQAHRAQCAILTRCASRDIFLGHTADLPALFGRAERFAQRSIFENAAHAEQPEGNAGGNVSKAIDHD
jgi:hypothetical protein